MQWGKIISLPPTLFHSFTTYGQLKFVGDPILLTGGPVITCSATDRWGEENGIVGAAANIFCLPLLFYSLFHPTPTAGMHKFHPTPTAGMHKRQHQ